MSGLLRRCGGPVSDYGMGKRHGAESVAWALRCAADQVRFESERKRLGIPVREPDREWIDRAIALGAREDDVRVLLELVAGGKP